MTNRAFGDVLEELEKLEREATIQPWASVGVQPLNERKPIGYAVCHGYDWIAQGHCEREADADLIAAARNALPRLIATARAAERLAEAGNKFKAANDEVRRLVVSGGIGRASYQAAVDTQQTAMLTFWRALAAYQTATKGE
jgi:hypothetical protein